VWATPEAEISTVFSLAYVNQISAQDPAPQSAPSLLPRTDPLYHHQQYSQGCENVDLQVKAKKVIRNLTFNCYFGGTGSPSFQPREILANFQQCSVLILGLDVFVFAALVFP
jgi:hypothetical protein